MTGQSRSVLAPGTQELDDDESVLSAPPHLRLGRAPAGGVVGAS